MKSSDTGNEGTPISYALPGQFNSFIHIDYNDFRVAIDGEETGRTGVSANDGEWHHIAVTWQSSGGEVNITKDGESRDFEITPLKTDHGFSPPSQWINLNLNTPVNKSVDFIDTTSYTLAGTIQFAGTGCAVENVTFLVNDIPEEVKTNAKGEFRLTIERAGTYRIKPVLEEGEVSHTFSPSDTTLIVETNILDLTFTDTQECELTTRLRGPCDTHIGSATFQITSLGNNAGCYQQTIDTDDSGTLTLMLPAQPYAIEMTNMQPFNPRIMEYFSVDTVDLTWGDQVKYFTYRQPPAIRVTGFPEIGTGAYQVPIMEQHVPYHLLIEVMDYWEDDSCSVNEGSITIYDDIAGRASKPVELLLTDSLVVYTCIPGNPNILSGGEHPYQRLIQIVAHVGEEDVSYEQWALVTGQSPRSQTFMATTPEIPQIILHDPPGDQSYSFMAQDSTYTVSHTHTYESAGGGGLFLDAKIGAVVGEEGDVYIGASYINLYAITDVITYNWNSGQVDESMALAWQPEKIRSTFAYTESHILHTLMPQLKELKAAAQSSGDQDLELEYDASLSIWQQIIEQNRLNKENTVKKKIFRSVPERASVRPILFSRTLPIPLKYPHFLKAIWLSDWASSSIRWRTVYRDRDQQPAECRYL